jgi:hypothetical protein
MERKVGAAEAVDVIRKLAFDKPEGSFDDAFATDK